MSEVERAIDACIDEIWESFDQDKNGYLDRAETKKFIDAMLAKMEADGVDVDAADFDECFDAYDKNHDDKLSRDEMRVFVEQLMGVTAP
ncbi:hypothetical protein LEN26_021184 [Aphanomyces euteiches]|nr:hypothetical protein LEN26_021184 [Aphanomyces euteiches]KAH9123972.1 hypothetical protein AeMF1_005183 [Aphanomyces euteiches]KAH9195304.1 hypothetical protein AeNC1_002717 [Aphanomyces euteiches]